MTNIKDITEKLEQGIKDLYESDHYKDYLDTAAKFHEYSMNNIILILKQMPNATHVAGYKAWQNNFGRNVKKGEKAIRIIAPRPFKAKERKRAVNPDTQQYISDAAGNPVYEDVESVHMSYTAVSVFDISQTEGKPMPAIVNTLDGTVEGYSRLFEALKAAAPVPVAFDAMQGTDANGYFNRAEHRIAIREGMSEAQTIKTTVHEIAHSILHDAEAEQDKSTKELEAESVAYIVCAKYGIDTSDYSFGYIIDWAGGKSMKDLKSSLSRIRDAAAKIIESVEKEAA